jgi:tRNA-dihydrouridine synthase C
VIANGNVVDAETALAYHRQTGAAGLMVGRGAIRNPWIFARIATAFSGKEPTSPTRRDLLDYIRELSEELAREHPDFDPILHIQRMKKTLIYICEGIDPDFEREIRRMRTPEEFEALSREHLDNPEALKPLPPADSRIFCGFAELLTAQAERPL